MIRRRKRATVRAMGRHHKDAPRLSSFEDADENVERIGGEPLVGEVRKLWSSFNLISDSAEGVRIPFDREEARRLVDHPGEHGRPGPMGERPGCYAVAGPAWQYTAPSVSSFFTSSGL